MKSNLIKKILIFLGLVIGLLSLALVLPFLIDFNKFKPDIQRAVSQKLNAEVDFSSARLTLLTGLGVTLQDVKLTHTDPQFGTEPLFSVKEIRFFTDLFPLLQGKFHGTLVATEPHVVWVSGPQGSNFSSLLKPQDSVLKSQNSDSQAPTEAASQKETSSSAENQDDFLKDKVLVKKISINRAHLTQVDLIHASRVREISDLQLQIENIGLEKDTVLTVSTDVKIREPDITLEGPVTLKTTSRVTLKQQKFEEADFSLQLSLDQMHMRFKDAFLKKPGQVLGLWATGKAQPQGIQVTDFKFLLHNLALQAKANVTDFKTLSTLGSWRVQSEDLGALGQLLPKHAPLLQNAKLDFSGELQGDLGTLKPLKVTSDLSLILSGSDVQAQVRLGSLKPIQGQVKVASQRLDVGALVGPFLNPGAQVDKSQLAQETKPEAPAVAVTPSQEGSQKIESPVAGDPQSAPLKPKDSQTADIPWRGFTLEQKAFFKDALVKLDLDLKEILYAPYKIAPLRWQVDLNQFLVKQSLVVGAWGAHLDMWSHHDLQPFPPVTQGQVKVTSALVDLNGFMDPQSPQTQAPGRESAGAPQASAGASPPHDGQSPASDTAGEPAQPSPLPQISLPENLRPWLSALKWTLSVDIQKLLYKKLAVDRIQLNFEQKGLLSLLQKFSFSTLQTAVGASAAVDFAPKEAQVKASLSVKSPSIDVAQIKSQLGLPHDSPHPAVANPSPSKGTEVRDGVTDGQKQSHNKGFPSEPSAQAPKSSKEFELTLDQKKFLKNFELTLDVQVQRFKDQSLDVRNAVLKAKQRALTVALQEASFRAFDGAASFKGDVDLAPSPILWRGQTQLTGVRVEQILEWLRPEHKDLLKGRAHFDLNVDGRGTTLPSLNQFLNAKGKFAFLDGQAQTGSVVDEVQNTMGSFLKTVSYGDAAEKALNDAESLLASPVVKRFAGQKAPPDLLRFRKELEAVKTLKFAEKGDVSRSLKDVSGALEIKNGKLLLKSQKATHLGAMALDSEVGLDASLSGKGQINVSKSVQEQLLKQSKSARFLWAEDGQFPIDFTLGGTLQKPTVSVMSEPIKKRFMNQAAAALEKEAKQEAQKYVDALLKGQRDKVTQELKQKVQQGKEQVKEELTKQKDEVKQSGAEQRKRLEDEAKKKLRGLFGR